MEKVEKTSFWRQSLIGAMWALGASLLLVLVFAFLLRLFGSANAGRIMMLFNDNEETGMKIEKVEQPDFADRYNSLASHCRQQIFSSFHANPNLFGIPTENLGFNNEEYESAFKLFNRTMIQPVQDMIVDAFDTIFGKRGSVQIKPFSIEREATIVE